MQVFDREERARSPSAARPLLRVALALVAGSVAAKCLATSAERGECASSIASSALTIHALATYSLAALAGAWCVACTVRARLARRGRAGARWTAPISSEAARWPTLAILALLAFVRALPRAPPDEDRRSFDGVWSERARSRGNSRGRVVLPDRSEAAVELECGLIADGERVRFRPSGERSRSARGPVALADLAPETWTAHADELARTAPAPAWRRAFAPLGALRGAIIERCNRLDEPASRQLAQGLLVGEEGALDAELADLYTRTGLRHVLAVSGVNVALLAAICWWPAGGIARQRGRSRRRTVALASIQACVLCAYVVVAGNGAPVRRSSVALALALLAPAFLVRAGASASPRRPDALSLWSLGLVLEGAVDPRELTSLSLALSYAATLGLILGTGPLSRGLRALVGVRSATNAHQLGPSSLARVVARRLASASCTAVAASIGAVLATLPLCWSHFSEWSPIGILATPLSLPLFAWLLGYGWSFVAAPAWLPSAAFDWPAHWLVTSLAVCDELPGTPCRLPTRPFALLAAASALFFFALHATRWRRTATRAGCVAWACLLVPWEPSPASVEIVALDVGHGSALAIRAPGPQAWLFDAGSKDRTHAVSQGLAPLLGAWDVRELGVVLSHGDRDHSGSLPWVAERYGVTTWAGALPAPLGERLPHTVPRLDVEDGALRLPSDPRDALELTLLRAGGAPGNEGSRSLLVAAGGERWLLCGDATDDGLRRLLELEARSKPLDVLLWPHHGSDTRWLGRALAVLDPREVWISASQQAPIERELARRGIAVRATWRDGPLASAAPQTWHGYR